MGFDFVLFLLLFVVTDGRQKSFCSIQFFRQFGNLSVFIVCDLNQFVVQTFPDGLFFVANLLGVVKIE